MHKSSYEKMKWFKNTYLKDNDYLNILDIGSLDTKGEDYNYKSIFNYKNWKYTGLDFEKGHNVDIVVDDIYNLLEIPDRSYDVVVSGQLFEHLKFFWITMSEIERILKPGGYCCIIAPSGGPKHGFSNYDCYRFSKDGMESLAEYVNLEIIHCSTDIDAKPWCDTCLVAKKEDSLLCDSNLNDRISRLEGKIHSISDYLDV